MARSVEQSQQQAPILKRVQSQESEVATQKSAAVERAPDIDALVQTAMHSSFGNALVQAAMDGVDMGGLGQAIVAEFSATSAGMGAISEEGTGLLAAGNAAVAKLIGKPGEGKLSEVDALNNLRGGGSGVQLPIGIREQMERVFGRSFRGVRIHTDTTEATAALGAEAVAMGSHLHFAEGAYSPGSTEGKAVIAHELTHVVQAEEGRLPGTGGVSNTGMAAEKEAYANESLASMPTLNVDSVGTDLGGGGSFGGSMSMGTEGMSTEGGFGSFGVSSFGVGSFGMSSMSLAPLMGAMPEMGASSPMGASTSAPAMLRESDDVDKEESNTEASARHEVAMGLKQGFSRAIDMSQGSRTVNVPKEGTGRKDGVFTAPSANGHLAVDEYNGVMRDIGPDGESKSSGSDEFTVGSAQNTQTANDGHAHLDGDPKLGATPETTATAPGGDPVMGGETGGMVAGSDKASSSSEKIEQTRPGTPQAAAGGGGQAAAAPAKSKRLVGQSSKPSSNTKHKARAPGQSSKF